MIDKKRKWTLISVIVILVISNLYFAGNYFSQKEYDLYYVKAVSDIQLEWLMGFYGETVVNGEVVQAPSDKMYAFGTLTGFVKFQNKSDQPKDARQYYRIIATDERDDNGNQVFYLEEFIKMNSLPPHRFEKERLEFVSDDSQSLMLKTSYGMLFQIEKRAGIVKLVESDTTSTLIFSDSEFRDFMLDFHK